MKIETPPPGLRSLPVLDGASMMKLGLFDAGEDGRLPKDTNLTHHGLRRIRNPLNFNPNTGLFLIDNEDRTLRGWDPCHPDEIAIPTYFVSYETLVFVGFTKIKAMELWESYKKENDAADESVPDDSKAVLHQNTFRILRHAQRYLKSHARHATTFRHLQDVGFDSSTAYVGFQPSMRYSNGSPALDTVDVLQPSGGHTRLLAWALRLSFRRFIFLSQLNGMLEAAELEDDYTSRVRPTMFHWKQLITLFETNENRGNFLPEDDDSFDSEITDTDAEGSDVVELYAEKKEGKDGATKKAEKKPGAFLVWEPSKVETHQEATSKIEMGKGVFPDKDTSEAETPRPFLYYSNEDKELMNAAHHYFEEGLETPNPFPPYSDEAKKLIDAAHQYFEEDSETPNPFPYYSDEDKTLRDGAHHYFDEEETDTKAPALTLKTEKLAEDKKLRDAAKQFFDEDPETDTLKTEKLRDAAKRFFDEDPETDIKAPAASLREDKKPKNARRRYLEEDPETDAKALAATVREGKKPKIADAELMPPPPPPPARHTHVLRPVTKNKMNKVNQEVVEGQMKGKKGKGHLHVRNK